MKCYNCDGSLLEETRELEINNGEYKMILKGVRAYVCDKCGEVSYSAKDLKIMKELSRAFSNYSKEEIPDWLDVSEVADLLKVSNQTIYNMIKDKRLKPVKIGKEWRFLKKDLDTFINEDFNNIGLAARSLNNGISEEDLKTIQECMNEEEQ